MRGLHMHIGSQIRDLAPFRRAVEAVAPLGDFPEIDLGGGLGVAYTSDIPLLSRWGTPLLFGPGSIHVAHTTDEFIDVKELRQAVDSYERIVRTLLAS